MMHRLPSWYSRLTRWRVYFAGFLLGFALLFSLWLVPGVLQPLARTFPTYVEVKPGTGFGSLSRRWNNNGWLTHPLLFRWLGYLYGVDDALKSGEYELPRTMNLFEIYGVLASGKSFQRRLTFPEGIQFKEMLALLHQAPSLEHALVNQTPEEILHRLQQEISPLPFLEGMFFPDTYFYHYGMSDIDVLKSAHHLMQQHSQIAWESKDASLPYKNIYELLTMASIVEKETGHASERKQVASVFTNRLQKNMRLQADPTVIYGVGDAFGGDITKKHLKTDTPYNTYTRRGLPPTPIAMPGRASLEAAAQPAKTDFIYFVADEEGGHYFSKTLDEHNKAVQRYRLHQQKKKQRNHHPDTGKLMRQ